MAPVIVMVNLANGAIAMSKKPRDRETHIHRAEFLNRVEAARH